MTVRIALGIDDGFPAHDSQRVWCHYCGARLAAVMVSGPPERWKLVPWPGAPANYRTAHIDHMRPRARGGTNDPWNTVPSCAQCNTAKGITPYAVFRLGRS